MNRIVLFLLCFLFVLPIPNNTPAQASDRRDGNWWTSLDRGYKLNYTVGFFDGMDLGYNFSYWAFFRDTSKASCLSEVSASYTFYSDKFLSNVTNDQLVDGLDSFYSDYRNRRIMIRDGVWLVTNGIAGTPREQLDKMIEKWRANAAQ